MKKLLFIFVSCFLFACDDEPGSQVVLPSDLVITIGNEPGSGEVEVIASAVNANYFLVFFGTGAVETGTLTNNGKISYTYTKAGTYTIRVQAHATSNGFISESENVTITLPSPDDVQIPQEGFVSAESYEGMNLVWQDEFNGTELNGENWRHETGGSGWGNNELQYYRPENTTVKDGYLIITAKKELFQGNDYTSSRIITSGKKEFQYGRIDIRAALPKGQGIWPALWMLGSDFFTTGWPTSGEIDIMEMIGGAGRENTVHGTVHWDHNGQYANYGKPSTLSSGTYNDTFHVFSIVWNETSIIWYVDDVQFNIIDITPAELSEFRNEFFFIFNVAVGGNWPGSPDASTVFPQHMIVDYVRVFQ